MLIRALAWNLYHGRDHPPDPSLLTWRSRLLHVVERGDTHAQVNRDLLSEFATVLSGAEWDVALLQEVPPRWVEGLARACEAEAHVSLTSRNLLPALQWRLARMNPDLMGSWDGGSNATLARSSIAERREVELRRRPARRRQPERRAMALTRLDNGICVANLHASRADPASLPEEEVRLGARAAVEWAREQPLIFGGDLNLRPRETAVFAELEERHGFTPPTAPSAIDHLLARGLEPARPPTAWRPELREIEAEGLAIRLSDHAPVEATFSTVDAGSGFAPGGKR